MTARLVDGHEEFREYALAFEHLGQSALNNVSLQLLEHIRQTQQHRRRKSPYWASAIRAYSNFGHTNDCDKLWDSFLEPKEGCWSAHLLVSTDAGLEWSQHFE